MTEKKLATFLTGVLMALLPLSGYGESSVSPETVFSATDLQEIHAETEALSPEEIQLKLDLLADGPNTFEKSYLNYRLGERLYWSGNRLAATFYYQEAIETCGLLCETKHPYSGLLHRSFGRMAYEAKNYDQAQLHFQSAISMLSPHEGFLARACNSARRELAQTLFQLNRDPDQATMVLEDLLAAPPEDRWEYDPFIAFLELGKIHLRKQNHTLAAEYLQRAMTGLPEHASMYRSVEAHVALEILWNQWEQPQKARAARQALSQMLEEFSEKPNTYIRLRQYEAEVYRVWEWMPESLAVQQELLAYCEGLPEAALPAELKALTMAEIYKKISETHDKTDFTQKKGHTIYFDSLGAEKARKASLEALDNAIALLEPYEDYQQNLAYLLVRRGKGQHIGTADQPGPGISDFEKAYDLLKKTNTNHPDLAFISSTLGRYYMRWSQDYPKAEYYFRQAVRETEANPTHRTAQSLAVAYHNLGLIYRKTNQPERAEHNFFKALAYYDAVQDHAVAASIRENLIELLRKRRNYPELYKVYKGLLEDYRVHRGTQDRKYRDTLFWLANIATTFLEDHAAAEPYVLEAIELTQPNRPLKGILANIYFKQGKYADALPLYEELVRTHPPGNPPDGLLANYHERLAMLYRENHQDRQAKHHYREAIKIYRSFQAQDDSERLLAELLKLDPQARLDEILESETTP